MLRSGHGQQIGAADVDNIPYGYCQCGCGQKTNLAPHTNRTRGWVKDCPLRYIQGHNTLVAPSGGNDYIVEDRGFPTPCWIWQRGFYSSGYGSAKVPGKRSIRAHRLYYEKEFGEIPPDLEIDHLCNQPACCRPSHLEPITHVQNVRRGNAAKLNQTLVDEIRTQYATGTITCRQLAKMYHVAPCTIGRIVRKQTWV